MPKVPSIGGPATKDVVSNPAGKIGASTRVKTYCRQEDSQYEASDALLQLVACMPPFVRQPAQITA